MSKPIARLREALLRLLFPARGRHRAPVGVPATAAVYVAPVRVPVWRGPEVPLRGEDADLVRPYLLTPEERRERWEQRRRQTQPARRRTLVIAR
ncbi:hypothetical protein [Streptomyces lydicus]|uniref:hypothetical protein n=1 Tax=Streptomyces lydicus TaxID=47763 RepID=UPI0036E4A57B